MRTTLGAPIAAIVLALAPAAAHAKKKPPPPPPPPPLKCGDTVTKSIKLTADSATASRRTGATG
jgi:hypothetical protein